MDASTTREKTLRAIVLCVHRLQFLCAEALSINDMGRYVSLAPINSSPAALASLARAGPTTGGDTFEASLARFKWAEQTVYNVQDRLELIQGMIHFDGAVREVELWESVCGQQKLPSGGHERWYIPDYTFNRQTPHHRVGVLANAASTASDRCLLRSEALSALLVMLFVLIVRLPDSNQAPQDDVELPTIIWAVGCKARVLHAHVRQGEPEITYSRYFDTATAELEDLVSVTRLVAAEAENLLPMW